MTQKNQRMDQKQDEKKEKENIKNNGGYKNWDFPP